MGCAFSTAFGHCCLQDALVVLAYAPKQEGCKGICSWPWGYALHSAALEGLQVNLDPVTVRNPANALVYMHYSLHH